MYINFGPLSASKSLIYCEQSQNPIMIKVVTALRIHQTTTSFWIWWLVRKFKTSNSKVSIIIICKGGFPREQWKNAAWEIKESWTSLMPTSTGFNRMQSSIKYKTLWWDASLHILACFYTIHRKKTGHKL
jgi:hypothetical protein